MLDSVANKIAASVNGFLPSVRNKLHHLQSPAWKVSIDGVANGLEMHMAEAQSWAETTSIPTIGWEGILGNEYVDLDLLIAEKGDEDGLPIHASSLVTANGNVVILGAPGAGKTTTAKRLVIQMLEALPKRALRVPILIECRWLRGPGALLPALQLRTGLGLNFAIAEDSTRMHTITLKCIALLLDSLDATIVIDGFDELPRELSDEVWSDLLELARALRTARIFLTCRSGAYERSLPRSQVLVIAPLSEEQIAALTAKWLGEQAARSFLARLQATPYAGAAVRPLTLVHLCHYYRKKGGLPDRPRQIYEYLVDLYCEKWDDYRTVRRESEFAAFDPYRKREFLQSLAFELACHGCRGAFTHDELKGAYHRVYQAFELPVAAGEAVSREIEAHTGLVLQVSEERYQFYHLSVQEFLVGEYLSRLRWQSVSPWKLPDEYAVAVALTPDPGVFLAELLVEHGERGVKSPSWSAALGSFVERLVVERPNWRPSGALGAAVCALHSAGQALGEPTLSTLRPSWESALRSEALRASIGSFLREYTQSVGRSETAISVRLRGNTDPLLTRIAMSLSRAADLVLDRRWYEAALAPSIPTSDI